MDILFRICLCLPRLHHDYITIVSRLHHDCITIISRLHHDCITIGSRLHHDYIMIASRLHHDWITIASRLHHDCITIECDVSKGCGILNAVIGRATKEGGSRQHSFAVACFGLEEPYQTAWAVGVLVGRIDEAFCSPPLFGQLQRR